MPIRRSLTAIRLRLARRRVLRAARSWLSEAFGVPRDTRAAIVERMLEGHARSAPIYWLQLCVALGLASLGLVLNGTAVVIGAMLVSPLMGPIVELGMGLAVGSPLLSIRSLVRTFWSIVVVIGGAALLTSLFPFREVTAEIAARASPTALDLLVAIFCAFAAAFTTLRSASDGVSTAAGTAIAIALVPPLCVVGFGVGTADWPIAQGAFLLFTANLCGILLFTALTFWLFGFNLVETRNMEEQRLEDTRTQSRLALWVKAGFGSSYGTWLRLLIPLALVLVVWFPLTRALRTVSWEVRARKQVEQILQDLPLARTAVRSSVSVEHNIIHLRLVVVSKPGQARVLEGTLSARIARATGRSPVVEVVAVPDLETMEEVAHTLARSEATERPRQQDLPGATAEVGAAQKQSWPAEAGAIRRWHLDSGDSDSLRLEIVHLGEPLGSTAQKLLASLLSERLHAPLEIQDAAIPTGPFVAKAESGADWLPKLASAVQWVRADGGLKACVTLPPAEGDSGPKRRKRRPGPDLAPIREAALATLAGAPPDQIRVVAGPEWSVQVRADGCDEIGVPP